MKKSKDTPNIVDALAQLRKLENDKDWRLSFTRKIHEKLEEIMKSVGEVLDAILVQQQELRPRVNSNKRFPDMICGYDTVYIRERGRYLFCQGPNDEMSSFCGDPNNPRQVFDIWGELKLEGDARIFPASGCSLVAYSAKSQQFFFWGPNNSSAFNSLIDGLGSTNNTLTKITFSKFLAQPIREICVGFKKAIIVDANGEAWLSGNPYCVNLARLGVVGIRKVALNQFGSHFGLIDIFGHFWVQTQEKLLRKTRFILKNVISHEYAQCWVGIEICGKAVCLGTDGEKYSGDREPLVDFIRKLQRPRKIAATRQCLFAQKKTGEMLYFGIPFKKVMRYQRGDTLICAPKQMQGLSGISGIFKNANQMKDVKMFGSGYKYLVFVYKHRIYEKYQ